MSAFGAAPNAINNPNHAYIIPHPPNDTISRIRFSPSSAPDTYLAASSWDGSVRLWKIDAAQGKASAVSLVERQAPVLDCAWSLDGRSIYCASVDTTVIRWDLETNGHTIVAAHDNAVRHCCEVKAVNYLVTSSWDKTVRYWDPRSPTGSPAGTVNLDDRVYAMDVRGPLLVLGLAERKLVIFDVRKPTVPFQVKYSQLRYQTRCIATWPDSMGYIVGSVEGKVSVDYVQEAQSRSNYKFFCHRDKSTGTIYAINSIRFHEQSGMFATAGSDGNFFFWDKDKRDRARTRNFKKMDQPICDIDFSSDGNMFAYSTGYDWSQGAAGNKQPGPDNTNIFLHTFEEGELQGTKGGNNHGRGYGGRRRGRGR